MRPRDTPRLLNGLTKTSATWAVPRVSFMVDATAPTKELCSRSSARLWRKQSLSITRTVSLCLRQRLVAILPTRCRMSHNGALERCWSRLPTADGDFLFLTL